MKWILGALLLLFAGFVFELGPLVYAMYVLIGVLLVSRFLTFIWIESMSVKRDCNRFSCQIGETVAVAASVRNMGLLPVPWILVEDALPQDAILDHSVKPKGPRVSVAQLFPLAGKNLLYQLTFQRRGYYQVGPMLLESGDLFGLHRRFKVGGQPNFILVYPKVVPLDGYDIASRRPIGEVKMMHRLFEDPTRISGVRAYEAGDPLNRVHWRATARTGQLHSKTYDPSCIAGMTLLLDFHEYSHRGGSFAPMLTELCITTAASLANTVYQMNQQVGLISNGRDAVERVKEEGWKEEFRTRSMAKKLLDLRGKSDRLRPVLVKTARGADQLMRILETLARVELTTGLSFAQLVEESRPYLPRDSTIVAVLRHVSEETALALGSLKRSGYAVTAVVIVPERIPDWVVPPDWANFLLAQGIGFRPIHDEESLTQLCGQQMLTA
ncbi:MAG: DUF58 domain-containing protein [Verrucomicrobiales bacterium]|nr:DUF58 domain-containing protein [Verrucomicrobiales bacterium]|tara:strand:- start:13155 stop:14474 length:1320 start_codon:yes stop_codon:yes gene_type:complete